MLEPVMSVFVVEEDVLKDVIKFLFLFGKDRIKISEEFLIKNLGSLMDQDNRNELNSKQLLGQSFELFFKYLNVFLDDYHSIPKSIGTHVEFKFNRIAVWKIFELLIEQNDNFSIKRNVIINALKNTEVFFDSDKFCKFISDTINELVDNKTPFTIKSIENVFFLISKIISLYNFVKVNNVVISSVKKTVSSNEVQFDTGALTDIQVVIEDMVNTSLRSSVDELVLDEENISDGMDNLNYPIVPVTVFNDLKFFQEKRVFIFVGSSGVGKSMILCHIAANMWLESPYKKAPKEAIFYFTMENLKEEVAARILADSFYSQCGLNLTIDDVLAQKYTSTDKNMLLQKVKEKNRCVVIEYLPPKVYGAAMLRALIRKHMQERKVVPYAIIIDFLDQLRSEKKNIKDEHQELGEVVNEIKALASEFSVPSITVSHLNAEGCKLVKDDMAALGGRQMGKSLRKYENGDCVVFVDEENTGGQEYSQMNFFVSKHRYMRKYAKIYQKMYRPEYSYLGFLDKKSKNKSSNVIINKPKVEDQKPDISDIFSDASLGL